MEIMVKDHSDSKNPLHPLRGLLFSIITCSFIYSILIIKDHSYILTNSIPVVENWLEKLAL